LYDVNQYFKSTLEESPPLLKQISDSSLIDSDSSQSDSESLRFSSTKDSPITPPVKSRKETSLLSCDSTESWGNLDEEDNTSVGTFEYSLDDDDMDWVSSIDSVLADSPSSPDTLEERNAFYAYYTSTRRTVCSNGHITVSQPPSLVPRRRQVYFYNQDSVNIDNLEEFRRRDEELNGFLPHENQDYFDIPVLGPIAGFLFDLLKVERPGPPVLEPFNPTRSDRFAVEQYY